MTWPRITPDAPEAPVDGLGAPAEAAERLREAADRLSLAQRDRLAPMYRRAGFWAVARDRAGVPAGAGFIANCTRCVRGSAGEHDHAIFATALRRLPEPTADALRAEVGAGAERARAAGDHRFAGALEALADFIAAARIKVDS